MISITSPTPISRSSSSKMATLSRQASSNKVVIATPRLSRGQSSKNTVMPLNSRLERSDTNLSNTHNIGIASPVVSGKKPNSNVSLSRRQSASPVFSHRQSISPTPPVSGSATPFSPIKSREQSNSPGLSKQNSTNEFNSTHNESFGSSSALSSETLNRKRIANRRRTNVNATDVSRVTDMKRSKVVATKSFKREWSGAQPAIRESFENKVVEFAATFDKPLEQLIYPSLQLIDENDHEYEKKRNEYQALHGHYDNHFAARFDAKFPMPKKTDTAPQLLSEMELQKNVDNLSKGKDKEGGAVGKNSISPIAEGHSNIDSCMKLQDLGTEVPYFEAKWKADVIDKPLDDAKIKAAIFEKDMCKGEAFLRSKLRKKYALVKETALMEEREREKKALLQIRPSSTSPKTARSRKQNVLSLSESYSTTPDSLYQNLSDPLTEVAIMKRNAARYRNEHSEEALFAKVKSKLDESTIFEENPIKNGILLFQVQKTVRDEEMADEEEPIPSFNRTGARSSIFASRSNPAAGYGNNTAKTLTSARSSGLVIGSNTNNKSGMRSLLALSEQADTVEESDDDEWEHNMLEGHVHNNCLNAADKELDIHNDDAADDKKAKSLEQLAEERLALTDLSRIRRAMGSKYVGYDYPEIIGADGLDGANPEGASIVDNSSLGHSFKSGIRPSTSGGVRFGASRAAQSASRAQSASGIRSTPIKSKPMSPNGHPQSPYDNLRISEAETRPSTSGGLASNYSRMSSANSQMANVNRTISRIRSATGARAHSSGGFYKNSPSIGGGVNPHGFYHDDATATVDADSSLALLSSHATVVVDMDIDHATPKAKHRYAQDVLLLAQMKAGVLPEQLISSGFDKTKKTISIDVSHYGLGDEHGKCLGLCLGNLVAVNSLKLRDNRLTSLSVPTIVTNLSCQLIHLDLSQNELHGAAAVALSQYFLQPTCLMHLNTSTCMLTDEDIRSISYSLANPESTTEHHCLKTWNLAHNRMTHVGMVGLCEYLTAKDLNGSYVCTLTELDLSWNSLQLAGAQTISNALRNVGDKCKLSNLYLSANGLTDSGAQLIGSMMIHVGSLSDVNLTQNSIGGRACFVFARALRGHPSMRKLDLSENPLSEEGACALFRLILTGLPCFVMMRDCTLSLDTTLFNNVFPANNSPYELELTKPYDVAIFNELTQIALYQPSCQFESINYRNSHGREYTPILSRSRKCLILKQFGKDVEWEIPDTGNVTIHYKQTVVMPREEQVIDSRGLETLKAIIIHSRSPHDRKKWLRLLCADICITTEKAQNVIDEFFDKNIIGAGGLTKVDIVAAVWSKLIDTENKYDFLCFNLAKNERTTLTSILTFEQFKFNWVNPTGHWRIDLGNKMQRSVMMQIIAINNSESDFSKNHSRRGDTSQKGNWYNFRNEMFNGVDITIDKEYIDNLPPTGTLEFDYVSTTRPLYEKKLKHSLSSCSETATPVEDEVNTTTSVSSPPSPHHVSTPSGGATAIANAIEIMQESVISKPELEGLLSRLGLSSRKKLPTFLTMVTLIELQIAAAKYYFSINSVLNIMYTFNSDPATQAKVVVCLFSRIWDLWNFDMVARQLSAPALYEVVSKIGWLNCMNPLKPSYDFVMSLKHYDNRLHTVHLLDMCASEGGDLLKELPHSDLSIVFLFGKIASLTLDNKMTETVRMSYCDFGEMSAPVLWNVRREMMKKYLVGTYPISPLSYECISMYNEMLNAKTLTMGPIDMQYQSHLKVPKTKRRVKSFMKGLIGKQKDLMSAIALQLANNNSDAVSSNSDAMDSNGDGKE